MITNSILINPASIRAMYDTIATAIKECQLADEEYVTFRLETISYQQAQEIEKVISASVPGVTTSLYFVELPISDADKLNIVSKIKEMEEGFNGPEVESEDIPSKLNVYFIKVSWKNNKSVMTQKAKFLM